MTNGEQVIHDAQQVRIGEWRSESLRAMPTAHPVSADQFGQDTSSVVPFQAKRPEHL
jgi:hypothetical protein